MQLCARLIVVVFFSFSILAKVASANALTYEQSVEILATSVYYADLAEAQEIVREYPTELAYMTLRQRVESLLDLDLSEKPHDFTDVVTLLLDSFRFLGSQKDMDLVSEIMTWAERENLNEEIRHRAYEVLMELNSIPKADLRSDLLLGPKAKGEAGAVDHSLAVAEVKDFFLDMQQEVKGQDEILKSLRTLYLKDLLHGGQRKAPEVFYFLGLPGNGKDTIAEAYVKALWGYGEQAVNDHMFRMNIRNKAEAWTYFGSSKGYIGSEEFPAFLRFLVEHSGGKYVIAKDEKGREIVETNPEWKNEKAIGVAPPHKAVIFVNEAHNIPKQVKDNVLKQAIERGIFPITNPGNTPNSVSEIQLPVTFIFASNEGIELLEPREKNGARIGQPLSYERLLENYERVAHDKEALKQSILKNNGEKNNPVGPEAPGTSEEFLNRFPSRNVHILKPLSPEILKEITELSIRMQGQSLAQAKGTLGSYNIEVSERLLDFISEYKHIASENARPIKDRLESFIFDQIYDAILRGKVQSVGQPQNIYLDIKTYKNGVTSLVFNMSGENIEDYQFTRIIKETLQDRPQKPLSSQRVSEIAQMREVILENVFGVEHIVDSLVEAAIVSESEAKNKDTERPATVLAFLGKTSTGKTETAKQYVSARYGTEERPVVIDFNGVKTVDALEAKILGSFDGNKNPIASEFMKAYDRAPNGNIAFIFDEAANAPKELLKSLYEVLRESVATGFSDGKPRSMRNVTIILTGNAGEQIYNNIPTSLPTDLYERALSEVFKIFIQDEDLQRKILTESFPEALLARLGKNIYHFGPLSHAAKREIAQLKLLKGLKGLESKSSERGWKISFRDEKTLLRVFEMIEKEGFNHTYQGASIDKFVRESLIDKIKAKLLINNIENGSQVVLDLDEKPIKRQDADRERVYRRLVLTSESGEIIDIEVPTGSRKIAVPASPTDKVLTAYHEVGHELVSEVFFGDRERSKYLSIINGIAIIGGQLIPYEGIRAGELREKTSLTKEAVLRRAAVLSGGYVAQSLITLGGRHDSGKSNDMLRSTQLIRDSILKYGLAEEWGIRSIPPNSSVEDYINKELSDKEREKLNELTKSWLVEAEQLAREAILANANGLFSNMSRLLSEQGNMKGDQVREIYEQNDLVTERQGQAYQKRIQEIKEVTQKIDEALKSKRSIFDKSYTESNYNLELAPEAFNYLVRKAAGLKGFLMLNPWGDLSAFQQRVASIYLASKVAYTTRDANLSSTSWWPEKMANIEDLILEERKAQTDRVTKAQKFDIFEATKLLESSPKSGGLRCSQFLR